MAIAAGGLIKRSIHRDSYTSDSWDTSSTIVFNVQILNAKIFQTVTGERPPAAPANWQTYKKSGGKFFNILEASSLLAGTFGGVKSVSQLAGIEDESSSEDEMGTVDYYSIHRHLNQYLKQGKPKKAFRTAKDIEDDIAGSKIVSW
jgi:hypothetical protein